MRPLRSKWSWVLLLAAGSAVLVGVFGADPDDPGAARVAELIRQLGHDEYEKREAADRDLQAVGESALPALWKAADTSDDPEIRLRAHGLARQIMWSIRTSRSTGLELMPVATGTFTMGGPKLKGRQTDDPAHTVRLTRPFLIGVYEVTQAEYQKVTKANPNWFAPEGGGKDRVRGNDTGRFPVEQVTWFDALDFCNRLSKLDGFEPYYALSDVKREDGSIVGAAVKVENTNGYRLPTEAEWEFCCRAWTTTQYNFGFVRTGKEGNFRTTISGGYGGTDREEYLGRTAKVGSYKPNDWGLYDMHGNVGEWCWDWYDREYYENSPAANPTGPEKGVHRVVRGGAWSTSHLNCRSYSRYWLTPSEKKDHAGFRVARTP